MESSVKDRKKKTMVNPELGTLSKVVMVVGVIIFLIGIQGGLIGGVIGGVISYFFYQYSIKWIAKTKNVEAFVPVPQHVLEKQAKEAKSRKKFWIIFLSICGLVLLLVIVLARQS